MTTPAQPFQIGDLVDAVEFTGCFGDHHPRRCGLVVESVRLELGVSIPSYWRIKAVSPDPLSSYWVEGAADLYFERSAA